MAWGVTFRGFALSSANGIVVERVQENASVNIREQKLKEGGASLDLLSLSARTITLSGKVSGASTAAFISNLRGLQARLSDPTEGDLILDTHVLSAVPIPGQISFGSSILSATWSCRFVSESKFWKKATATTASYANFGTSGAGTRDGTMVYATTLAETYPSWTLTNMEGSTVTGLDLTIEDRTGGSAVQAFKVTNFTLGNADQLTIDPSAGQVYISISNSGASKPPQKIDGSFWSMSGATTDHDFRATISTTSLSTGVQLASSFYERYFSFGA